MGIELLERLTEEVLGLDPATRVGRVAAASGGLVDVTGLGRAVELGDRVRIGAAPGVAGEIVQVSDATARVLPEGSVEGLSPGSLVRRLHKRHLRPSDDWIGRIIDPDGRPLDGRPLLPGREPRPLRASPPSAHGRRGFGARLETGYALFNTLLPIVRGQRIGLFAGSGIGKSTLLAGLARQVDADVVVLGLVGERGRELAHFTRSVLGEEGMARSVVVAATSDRAPQTRRRCAWAATAVAEHFRAQGAHVLLLLDSVTRFAEAHREVAVASGEPAALRGFPASTAPAIAALCERAGPGAGEEGDITAIYSVLVAGSDMDEPVADWLRGVLDGHVVLDRDIAQRGRFPAVDVLRSVSRSLPEAASIAENRLLDLARRHLGTFAQAELMVQAGLYAPGSDPAIDEALRTHGPLEQVFRRVSDPNTATSFAALRQALATGDQG